MEFKKPAGWLEGIEMAAVYPMREPPPRAPINIFDISIMDYL
jgi:hypothetical protein